MRESYSTNQRKVINNYLIYNQTRFISAEEILNYMKDNNQTVGTSTVYRYLNLLEKQGVLRTETNNHTKYYQYISGECSGHFHLKCKKCGKTVHLDCKEFEDVNKHIAKEHDFKLDHNTLIYGICNKCSKNI